MFGLSENQKLDKKNFQENFYQSWYYDKIKHFDYESYEKTISTFWARDNVENIYDGEIFWYLKNIFDENPEKIYDIGCGNNFIKLVFGNYFNIYSLDVEGDKADEIINYKDWIAKSRNKIKAAYAINSFHFTSDFFNFTKVIESFISIFDKNGIGLLTLNFYFLIKNTPTDKLNFLFGTSKFNQANFEIFIPYLEDKLKKLINKHQDDVVFDIVDIDKRVYRNHINGNIRLLFRVIKPI